MAGLLSCLEAIPSVEQVTYRFAWKSSGSSLKRSSGAVEHRREHLGTIALSLRGGLTNIATMPPNGGDDSLAVTSRHELSFAFVRSIDCSPAATLMPATL